MEIENREARFNYTIEDTIESGIVLAGSEVKSIRLGKMSLKDSFVRITSGEVFLVNSHIATYEKTSSFALDTGAQENYCCTKLKLQNLKSAQAKRDMHLFHSKYILCVAMQNCFWELEKAKSCMTKKKPLKTAI